MNEITIAVPKRTDIATPITADAVNTRQLK
jgi:hypothetical protein